MFSCAKAFRNSRAAIFGSLDGSFVIGRFELPQGHRPGRQLSDRDLGRRACHSDLNRRHPGYLYLLLSALAEVSASNVSGQRVAQA